MRHIIANFKSNKNVQEMKEWIAQFQSSVAHIQFSGKIILCPPHSHLSLFESLHSYEHIAIGVQDISPFSAGSYTGAVGTKNIEDLSVRYAILGHSERRSYFHETSSDVANKVRECIRAGITPIVCVTKDQINEQANVLEASERSQVMVAFEPVDHIGTGISDSLEHIIETKDWVQKAFGSVPYIYGGSVNPHTDGAVLLSNEIDGFLVGSACLDATTFSELLSKV